MLSLFKTIMHKPTYQTSSDIAIYFNISARELNQIFLQLKWAEKEDKWWIATELGLKHGASQEYNTRNKQKFIKWDTKVKENNALIDAINTLKNVNKSEPDNKTLKKTTYKEKVDKGKEYEEYIAKYYERLGYYVWQHGKDKGVKDNGIDLIAKKGKEILFIQCKNWSLTTSYQINHEKLKATRQDVVDYIEKNPIFKTYDKRTIYVLSNDILHKSAYYYLEEYKDDIECKIIPYPTELIYCL